MSKCRGIRSPGSDGKLEVAKKRGADELINHNQSDVKKKVLELTDGRGADVCIDTVGGDAFDSMSRCMNYDGRLLVLGFSSGRIPQLSVNLLLLKNYQAIGVFWWPAVERNPQAHQNNFEHLAALYHQGKLNPLISRTYPLDEAIQAIKDSQSRQLVGKLIVTPTVLTNPSDPE